MSNTNKPLSKKQILAESIEQYISQQTAAKDARIAELEENYRQLLEDRDDYKEQAAALREELAATEKMMMKYKSDLDRSNAERLRQAQILQSYKDRSDDVEAVKKERDHFAKMVDREVIAKNKAQYQRDEAVKMVEYAQTVMPYVDCGQYVEQWHKDAVQFLSRLSSGETKPASPWNDMPVNFPADGQKILIWSPAYEDPEKRIWQSNWEKGDWTGFKWTPYPAPPESLTDKK